MNDPRLLILIAGEFSNSTTLRDSSLRRFAVSKGFDVSTLWECMNSGIVGNSESALRAVKNFNLITVLSPYPCDSFFVHTLINASFVSRIAVISEERFRALSAKPAPLIVNVFDLRFCRCEDSRNSESVTGETN